MKTVGFTAGDRRPPDTNKKAAHGAVASGLWRETSNGALGNGLGSNITASRSLGASLSTGVLVAHGSARPQLSANIAVPLRSKRCELGGLQDYRRMTAAPAHDWDVAFSFGGVRIHGLIAPALYRSCGLMPCGNPSGLPCPIARSANPHGVALLLAERGGFRQSETIGACHE